MQTMRWKHEQPSMLLSCDHQMDTEVCRKKTIEGRSACLLLSAGVLGTAFTVGRMKAGSQLRGSGRGGGLPEPGARGRGYWLGSAGCSGG